MITNIFTAIFAHSITASYVILLVLLLRLLLKKSPKIFSYTLWSVVLFRLICPVTFESDFGIIPAKTSINEDIIISNSLNNSINDYIDYFDNNAINYNNENTNSKLDYATTENANLLQETPEYDDFYESLFSDIFHTIDVIFSIIWLVGFVVMLSIGLVDFIKIKKNLIGATRWKDNKYLSNIYLVDHINSPFVMGIFNPKIYIPSEIKNSNLDYIIAHENHHLKRFDHITRVVGFITLCVYWFNPLVWIAFVLSSKDMELSCDEYVLKKVANNQDVRADYAQSLLYFASSLTNKRKLLSITPHAFGDCSKDDTKERIVNIMKFKRPVVWVSLGLSVVVATSLLGLSSNQTETTVENAVANKGSFPMGNTQIKDINVDNILTNIVSKIDTNSSDSIEVYDSELGIFLTEDFSYKIDQNIGFKYNNSNNELLFNTFDIYVDNKEYSITNDIKITDENIDYNFFAMEEYLNSLKYLPQNQIKNLLETPANVYSIMIATEPTALEGRHISYDKNGLVTMLDAPINEYEICLEIQPFYGDFGEDNNAMLGADGNDFINVYYVNSNDTQNIEIAKTNIETDTEKANTYPLPNAVKINGKTIINMEHVKEFASIVENATIIEDFNESYDSINLDIWGSSDPIPDTEEAYNFTLIYEDTERKFTIKPTYLIEYIGDEMVYYLMNKETTINDFWTVSIIHDIIGVGDSNLNYGSFYSNEFNEIIENIESIKITYDDDIINGFQNNEFTNPNEKVILSKDYNTRIANTIATGHYNAYSVGGIDFNLAITLEDGSVKNFTVFDGVISNGETRKTFNTSDYEMFEFIMKNEAASDLLNPDYIYKNATVKNTTPLDEINITVLDANNNPVNNSMIGISPKHTTDYSISSRFVTDNNGEATGKLHEDFTVGEYLITATWIHENSIGFNSLFPAKIVVEITTENAKNLVVKMPYVFDDDSRYSDEYRIDFNLKNEDDTPLVNALISVRPVVESGNLGSGAPYSHDLKSAVSYTNELGKATLISMFNGHTPTPNKYIFDCIIDGEIVYSEEIEHNTKVTMIERNISF